MRDLQKKNGLWIALYFNYNIDTSGLGPFYPINCSRNDMDFDKKWAENPPRVLQPKLPSIVVSHF
jgi:hypothetical protein